MMKTTPNIHIKRQAVIPKSSVSTKTPHPLAIKTQERLAGLVTVLSAATSALGVAAQFTDKDLSSISKNLLTSIDVVSGLSTGIALAEWISLHNAVLKI